MLSEAVEYHVPQTCYCHTTRVSGLASTILQGTVPETRRRRRQLKRWKYKIKNSTVLKLNESVRAVEEGRDALLRRNLCCPNDHQYYATEILDEMVYM